MSIKFSDILAIAEEEAFVHPETKKVPAVVHTAIYAKSSKGNDMLSLTYRVTGGPNAGKGRPVRHYILFDRETGKQQVSNLGFPVKEFESLKELSAEDAISRIASVVIGKPCAIDVEPGDYNGRPQTNVKWVHAPQPEGAPAAAKARAVKKAEEVPDVDTDTEADEDLEALQARLEKAQAAKAKRRSTPPSDLPF